MFVFLSEVPLHDEVNLGFIGNMVTKRRECRKTGIMGMAASAMKTASSAVAQRRGSSILRSVSFATSNALVLNFAGAMCGRRLACGCGVKHGDTGFIISF